MNIKSKIEKVVKNLFESEFNEISSTLFKNATDISRSRGQDRRTVNMGSTFFNSFKGKPLLGGQINDIYYTSPQQANYKSVLVTVKLPESSGRENINLEYDVVNDDWINIMSMQISRADARILSLISQKINEKTKYGTGGNGFNIKGYGMNENDVNTDKIENPAIEIENEIDMRMRPDEYNIPYSEINEIAEMYGVDFETVLNIMQSYVLKRGESRKNELVDAVKEILQHFQIQEITPTFNTFLSFYKKNNYQDDLGWVGVDELKNEFLKQTTDPNQLSLFEMKIKDVLLKEYDDDFDEGPQPGDPDYHYDSGYKKANNGGDIFANIDWDILHKFLVKNTKIAKYKTEKGELYGINDFTDDDGFLSLSSLKLLENDDLIYIWNGIPIIDDEKYMDMKNFYAAAKNAWLKT